jgi:hypothetical protein
MSETADHVAEGRAAWKRLRNDRATFEDWTAVSRALVVGRTVALKEAGTNAPVGGRYNNAMGRWLVAHGLDGVNNQERYALFKILENLDAVTAWRDGLPEPQRRKHNHPSLWHVYRRATKPATAAPQRRIAARIKTAAEAARQGKPIYWPQDAVRRAHTAMLDSRSSDLLTLARVCLEAAVRSTDDLMALLPAEPPTKPAPAKAPAATVAALV